MNIRIFYCVELGLAFYEEWDGWPMESCGVFNLGNEFSSVFFFGRLLKLSHKYEFYLLYKKNLFRL